MKLTSYHEVDIYTQGKIFVEDDFSAYEYSKIRVRKCRALSQYRQRGRDEGNWDGSNGKGRMSLEKWNRRGGIEDRENCTG